MTLAEEMLYFRARHGMSQRKFAEIVGVTVQTINSVENGLQKPSKTTEAKIRIAMEERG